MDYRTEIFLVLHILRDCTFGWLMTRFQYWVMNIVIKVAMISLMSSIKYILFTADSIFSFVLTRSYMFLSLLGTHDYCNTRFCNICKLVTTPWYVTVGTFLKLVGTLLCYDHAIFKSCGKCRHFISVMKYNPLCDEI